MMFIEEINWDVDSLRCYICRRYLIWPPIVRTPNGDVMCGHCALTYPYAGLVRQVGLEEVLRSLLFPCKNKARGCLRRLRFGQPCVHEDICIYNTALCPVPDCAASDFMIHLPTHLFRQHVGIMKTNFKFDIEINRDYKEISAATINSITYVLKYQYNADERIFSYDFRRLRNKSKRYKVILYNAVLPNRCVLKRGGYIASYLLVSPRVSIDIHKLLPELNDPQVVTVIFVTQGSMVNKQTQTDAERLPQVIP